MFRVGLCLSGLVGGTKGKDSAGATLDVEMPFEHYKQHILSKNDVDVFIHSWSVEQAKQLQELYHPLGSVFEKQMHFSDDFRKHITYSRWYGQREAINLKRRYEEENHFQYDMVMIARLDLLWFIDVYFGDYESQYFYASHWNYNGPPGGRGLGPYDRSNLHKGEAFLDLWFFSSSPNMDKFGQLYNNLDGILSGVKMGNHCLSKAWVDQLGLPVKHVFWRGFDHEIYRRWRRPGWHTG